MRIEIIEDGNEIELPLISDDYDLMDDLEYLKTEFKPLIFNRSIIKYFGIDLVWHKKFR